MFGRRRPKRQRTPTTLYSDDNPSTFTVKKTKAERLAEELERQKEEERLAEEAEEELPVRQKRKYTRRKGVDSSPTNGTRPQPRVARPSSPVSSPTIETTIPVEQPVKRKRGRPPKNAPKINHLPKPIVTAPKPKPSPVNVDVATPTPTTTTPASTQTRGKRRRPGRPPSNKKSPPKSSPKPTTSFRKITTRHAPSSPLPSPVVDQMGTLLPQCVTVAPILPPTAELDSRTLNDNNRLSEQYPSLFGKGLGIPPPLKKPEWSLLYDPDVYFDRDYTDDSGDKGDYDDNQFGDDTSSSRPTRAGRRLDPDLLPVTRSVTCVATRRPDHQFMAVGDTAGFCVIYSLGPHIRPVARLESQACKQRAYEEQQSVREQHKKIISKKLRSLVVDTSQTTIHALGLVGSRVVLATTCELECMDVPSQTSLWVCPLSATDRMVTSLDMHLSTYDVLVSCRMLHAKSSGGATVSSNGSEEKQSALDTGSAGNAPSAPSTGMASFPSSPLMLLKHSQNNVEICDANSPILLKSPCCSAIWDSSPSNEDRLLFVAPDQDSQELELVLVQGGSIDNWKVACKTRIPVKSSMFQTKLSQSPQGAFTMVASSRGIRLYQTETLQLLHVYGDQLALHGKSIVWQDCLLLGHHRHQSYYRASRLDDEGVNGTEGDGDKIGLPHPPSRGPDLIEYEDALSPSATGLPSGGADSQTMAHRYDEDFADLGQYIVGVPDSSKGPKELCEALHVWRVAQPTTVPAHTLALPPKSDGVQSLVLSSQAPARSSSSAASNALSTHDRLVLATRSGECHELLPRFESDFAGIMYPAGYYVLDDNLEYIEDEDEMDIVVPDEDDDDNSPGKADEEATSRRRKFFVPDSEDEDERGEMDDVSDQDLKEAMRRSMLELRHTPGGIESKDDDNVSVVVDVVDDANVARQSPHLREPIVLPCRPEAYLQETLMADGRRKSAKDEHLPAAKGNEDGGFINQVLGIMPHFGLAEMSRRELEKRLSKTGKVQTPQSSQLQQQEPQESESVSAAGNLNTTTSIDLSAKQDSNSLSALRTGRSKRSRATSLEALLKASIDPHLQQQMASRDHRWANGLGSSLAVSESDLDATPVTKYASIETTSAELGKALKVPENGGAAKVSPGSDSLRADATTEQNGSGNAADEQRAKSVETVESSTYSDDCKAPDGADGSQEGNGSSVLLGADLRAEETAVAFGLLGLSPCLTNTASERESMIDETGSDLSRGEKQSQAPMPQNKEPVLVGPDVKCIACRGRMVMHSCGKRSLPIDFDEVVRAERDRKEKEEVEKRKQRAEKRRLADARRREARKQKQRELEELRKREEEELRRHEDARLSYVASSSLGHSSEHQDTAAYHNHVAVEPQSYAHEVQNEHAQSAFSIPGQRSALTKPPELASSTPWAASSDRIDTYDYGTQANTYDHDAQAHADETLDRATAAYAHVNEARNDGAPRQSESWSENSARVVSLNSYDSSVAAGDTAGDPVSRPISKRIREASGAVLSSAEALAALASVAGIQSEVAVDSAFGLDRRQPLQQYAYDGPRTAYSEKADVDVTYTNSSHGFNEDVPTSHDHGASVSAARSAIPSYAAIRAQETGNSVGGYEATSNGVPNHKSEQHWQGQNGLSNDGSNYHSEKPRWQYR